MALVAVLLLVVVIGPPLSFISGVDCKQVNQKAATLLQRKKDKQAYQTLNPHLSKCAALQNGNHLKKVSNRALEVQYAANYATAAYALQHNSEAFHYSKAALDMYIGLTSAERAKIPNGANLNRELVDIESYTDTSNEVRI